MFTFNFSVWLLYDLGNAIQFDVIFYIISQIGHVEVYVKVQLVTMTLESNDYQIESAVEMNRDSHKRFLHPDSHVNHCS